MHRLSQYQFHLVSTLLTFVAAATVSAQTSGGSIRGTVSHPSGAMVAGAAITIEEVSTSENWRLVSSSAGLYNGPNLPVGRYIVTVKAPGFSTAERTDIDVQAGSERVVNVQLALGESEAPFQHLRQRSRYTVWSRNLVHHRKLSSECDTCQCWPEW